MALFHGWAVAALTVTVSLSAPLPRATADVPMCDGLPATIVGTHESGTIDGTDGDDVIWVGDYPNEVDAGPGDDRVCGGVNADMLFGGEGNDRIFAAGGRDMVFGGTGDDHLDAGPGPDGGVLFSDAETSVTIDLVAGTSAGDFIGTDTLVGFTSVWAASTLGTTVRTAPDTLAVRTDNAAETNDDSNDTVIVPWQPAAWEAPPLDIHTGGGDDRVAISRGNVTADLGPGDDHVEAFQPLGSVVHVEMGDGHNTLAGTAGKDLVTNNPFFPPGFGGRKGSAVTVVGSWGPLDVSTGSGADTLLLANQSASSNVVRLGADDDTVVFVNSLAVQQTTRVFGGSGRNRISLLWNADQAASVDLASGTLRASTGGASPFLPGFTRFRGGAEVDSVLASNRADFISTGPGDDLLFGRRGNDTLLGGDGWDKVDGFTGFDRCVAERRIACEA